ncbi:MAG: TonB-dependent receptor [Pseudomonadota bacterium]
MKPLTIKHAIAFACAVTASATSFAKELPTYDIVYTPNRVAEKQSETLSNVTVITQEDIEQQNFQSVEEILVTLPGITIANNGGKGKVSSIFQRGTESDHTVVLVDGVRLVAVSNGGANLSAIPVSMIERIESVRGAASTIHGADAIGGVIQIFTKEATSKNRVEISTANGTENSRSTSINVGTKSDDNNAWVNLNASHEKTDGFNACSGNPTTFKGCFTNEPDEDGYKNNTIAINAGVKLADGKVTAGVSSLSSKGNVEFDGTQYGGNQSDNTERLYSANVKVNVTDNTSVKLAHQSGQSDSESYFNGSFVNQFDSKNKKTSLILNQQGKRLGVVLGAERLKETLEVSPTPYSQKTRTTDSSFISASAKLTDSFTTEASYRNGDSSVYGNNDVGAISFQQKLGDNHSINLSYKEAFKAPNYNELFSGAYANPNLAPEESESIDLTLKSKVLGVSNELSIYKTDVVNLIANDANFIPQNIANTKIKGIELSSSAQINNTTLRSQVSRVHAVNKDTGAYLARRPGLNGSISASQKIGKLSVGTTVNAQNHFFEPDGTRVSGFATVDANMQYRPSKQFTVGIKGRNLTDKQYETAKYYNQAGRQGEVFIKYKR